MQLWSKVEAARKVQYHPEHMMRLSRAGKFPQPIKLGDAPNCAVRFVAEEVEAWIEKRIAARENTVD